MTERPKQLQALDGAIGAWWHATASQKADTELIEASKAAIRSARAMLRSADLGTRLPGFEEFHKIK